ncbi:MAG TPA: YciI family protein [Pyrinomonadaceae bacterium]|nr:YciI family protein [Pyrinomonadaceae bacterium]
MRVMVIIKANADSEAGVMPSEKLLTEMGKFNEELVNAGVMLAGEGLHPSKKGKRVKFSGGQRIVTDGPFTETKDLVGGYWIWKVDSIDEAVDWVKRIPFDAETSASDAEVEIRPIFEAEDFGAEYTPELRAQEDRLRAEMEKQGR